jgi:RNA polymerase sigma factor (sigma-70 family)
MNAIDGISDSERHARYIQTSKRARFEREMLPHLDAAHSLAHWILKGSDDAQDVTQEAFLRAFKYFDAFHGDNAKAWLLSIVRNSCNTWLRMQPKTESMSADPDEEGHTNGEHERALEAAGHESPWPDARLIRQADHQLLQDSLAALPTEYREILVLRELEELSYKQISDVVGIPIGTVMSRLSRGRALLVATLTRPSTDSVGLAASRRGAKP